MNTISPLTGIPPVGSTSANSGGKGQGGAPRQGQFIQATVVEAKGNNIFLLDIGGSKIPAQARIPLSVGQTLQLQVAATSPQVQLRVVSDSANLFQGKSLTLLGENIDLKSLLSSIRTTSALQLNNLSSISRQTLESFFQLTPDSLIGKESGGLLKQFIDRIGLSFESLLARGDKQPAQNTLKAALLNLAGIFKEAGELTENTNRLLNTIELYQLAQLQLNKDNLFIFPLPIPFLEKGYLVIENFKEETKESDDSEENFSLHLALEGLGNLRIDVLRNSLGIYIRFISDKKEKLEFIREYTDELLPALVDTNILGVSFSLEPVDPAADLLKRLLPDGESIVNTKV